MRRVYYIGILLLFSILSFLALLCVARSSPWRDIAISIGSSGLFALLIELGFLLNDRMRFGYLSGEWERSKFFNRNRGESGMGYDDISDRYSDVPNRIRLTYKGEGEYKGTAIYEEGALTFILNLNKDNSHSGVGTYQYDITKSQSIAADIGQYMFLVDMSRNLIYITHQNILPSGNANGVEVWHRRNAST